MSNIPNGLLNIAAKKLSIRKIVAISVMMVIGLGNLQAQDFDWPSIAFKDSANFRILRAFEDKFPKQYILLNQTSKWNGKRFLLEEHLWDPVVKSKLKHDEHHPYNTTYIFRKPELDTTVSPGERKHLFTEATTQAPTTISPSPKNYRLTDSYTTAPDGFFFETTSPVFSSDKLTAYADMIIYKKTKETSGINDSGFATLLLIYKYSALKKEWILFKKISYLIL